MRTTSLHFRKRALIWALTAALAFGCAPTRVPSTSPDAIATIVAATQRAAPTFTPLPPSTPTSRPTRTPVPTPILGTPISTTWLEMPNGATTARVSGHIDPGSTQSFALRGTQGQPMITSLTSGGGMAALSMMSQGGTFFLRPGVADEWRGVLPQAGTYYLGIYGGAQPTDFLLDVMLITRVTFKEGENAVTLTGRTPDGTVSAWSVFGIKGNKISLTLSGTGSEAAMGIEGFVDRKTYLDANQDKRELLLVVPATQDYIVTIVPDPGATTNYVLDVRVD